MKDSSKRYHIVTLGCPKNIVDSEGMHSLLHAQGHVFVEQVEDADVIILNTCSFIQAARDESLQELCQLTQHKKPGQRIIAAGCMAESHPQLIQSIAGIDATLSTRQWMDIGSFINGEHAKHTPSNHSSAQGYDDWRNMPIHRKHATASAYLKISDGCNLRCSFCTIPLLKGNMRSKSPDAVLMEARALIDLGVQEIVLVAQHLTDYGRDLGLSDGLAMLLDELCKELPLDRWIRLLYAYPHSITPRLITTMAQHPQICHYLDMPLQHAHPHTLRRMNRPPDIAHTKKIIAALREAMPNIALRSTFIVGFPGETRGEFRTLIEFLEEIHFDWVGAFRYSCESGTLSAQLPHHVQARVIEKRWHQLMEHQQTLSLACHQRWQGKTIKVLIEGQGKVDDGRSLLIARSFREAPEIDGQILVWGDAPIGSFADVLVTQATAYDLWATIQQDEQGAQHLRSDGVSNPAFVVV